MVASVSAVLAKSFVGQLLSGEGIKTDFTVDGMGAEKSTEPETAETTEPESKDEAAADEKPARETVMFDVDLHCGGCEDRVTDALDEQEGVRIVRADADAHRIEVTFNPNQMR